MAALHGDTVALTEADGGAAHAGDHGPELLGLSAEGWVYVALTIFFLIAIFIAKAPQKIAAALDARIAETRRTLDEAKALRDEAAAVLADAKAREAATADDARAILGQAESEAKELVAKAEQDAADLIERRAQMAEDKIAAAERKALADIRARAADAATRAAAMLIAEKHDAGADQPLVDRTIASLN